MTRLEILVVVMGILFLIFAVDLYDRKKFNLLHFLVFGWGTGLILFFIWSPTALDRFWQLFGIARGADLIVYIAIIFLAYAYIDLTNKDTKKDREMTRLCTAHAIHTATSNHYTWQHTPYGFLIRAYNEEQMIGQVIDEIVQAWYTMLVVCNDGSADRTGEIVRQKQTVYADRAEIVLISHLINRGGWAANKTLFERAKTREARTLPQPLSLRGESIKRWVTYDADGQMSIEDMDRFEQTVRDDPRVEVVMGSRFVEWGVATDIPWMRRLILRWARVVTYVFNGLRLTDVSTWYRMYSSEILPQIELMSDWFSYQHDIIWSISEHHIQFVEVPVKITYTAYSLEKWQKNSNALVILKELFWGSWFLK